MMVRVADAARGNWVEAYAPQAWVPYLQMMRMDRPIGWQLLLAPCWQSIALAAAAAAQPVNWAWAAWLFAACLIGAILMRGAGCVVNDIVDRDIDAQVARTRSRPIPSGRVSVRQALILLGALCLMGLGVLVTLPLNAILLGLASAPLVAIYPFMKRFTWWPQLFLGLAFNWGALLGWTAYTGALDWPALLLYLGGVAWTIGYDTIYAHQDRKDDAMVGVKSTARLFGENSAAAIAALYAAAVILAGAAGAIAGLGWMFWVGLGAYAAHLGGQALRLDINNPALCLHLFKSNWHAGLLLLGAILIGAA